MGRLTTHVLDTAAGVPAAGVEIALYKIEDARSLVVSMTTNEDGRTDSPLLDEDTFAGGQYELEFAIGCYFQSQGVTIDGPAFLDVVPVRFSLADDSHYHIPLLASPWSYSTYRGS